MARWPKRKAAARTSSRAITAWVGCLQRRLRRDGEFVLALAVFGQEGIGLEPSGAKRGDKTSAEAALGAPGAETIGMAGTILNAGIDELLLEGGNEVKPARRIERCDSAARELARAALPRATIGVADIAEDEMLRNRAVGKIDARLRRSCLGPA